MRRVQKREYNRPHMRVVELRQRCHILTTSSQGNSATMSVEYYEEDI